ncbi:hypothetical protein [Fluviispira vulneris]|nr:hypothetical protein [Fluviispira vulneris]
MQKKNSIVLRALCLSGLLYISPVYSMGWLNKICREIGRVGDQVSAVN